LITQSTRPILILRTLWRPYIILRCKRVDEFRGIGECTYLCLRSFVGEFAVGVALPLSHRSQALEPSCIFARSSAGDSDIRITT
jgi:hypothetical protein